ncbi:hypothetical protein FGO68_gene1286 [Halteria grandinella]|uniref:DUF7630 domain-containing protein n=1 Tax=Halteria grandinella TaxID=5974 RepID=A0A8J8P946_HALGN|nr:hypothetical protein FGO68_gene1286 [Halteria grandinella]
MVNNPELMRCEYLGHLCLYGNYTHGCLKSHNEGELSQIVLATDNETQYLQFQEWTANHLKYYPDFKQAVAIIRDDYDAIERATNEYLYSINKCWKQRSITNLSTYQKCDYCEIGYYPQAELIQRDVYIYSSTSNMTDDVLEYKCVQRCKDGKYLSLYAPLQNSSRTFFGIESMECADCHSSCYQCLGDGPQMCTMCRTGSWLNITDNQLNVGQCLLQDEQINQKKTVELFVTGNRSDQQVDEFHFGGILQAMRFAYGVHQSYGAEKVIIRISNQIIHYVLMKDLVELRGFLIDDNNMIGANYQIIILSQGCSVEEGSKCNEKAKVVNKVGGHLKFYSPFGGNLTIKNLIIDSIDSVLDVRDEPEIPGTLSCLNSDALCCSIDIKSTNFNCTNPQNQTQSLKPRFHKFNACFVKPIGGSLIQFTIFDEGNQYDLINFPKMSSVLVEGCEFRNFFYEMNSIVQLPHNPDRNYVLYKKPQFNVTFVGNSFEYFSSCGSLIARTEPLEAADSYQLNNYEFTQEKYTLYHIQRQYAAKSYYERYSALHIVLSQPFITNTILTYSTEDPSPFQRRLLLDDSLIEPQQYQQSSERQDGGVINYQNYIRLANNTARAFNLLKRKGADADPYSLREERSLVRVQTPALATQGFVMDIFSDFTDSKVIVEYNTFTQIIQEFGYIDHVYLKAKTLCDQIDQPQSDYSYQNIFSDNIDYDPYLQLGSVLSFRQVVGSLFIIHGNTFHNISTTGPIVYFEEAYDYYNSTVVISGNNFNLIHGSITTTVIHLVRKYQQDQVIPYSEAINPGLQQDEANKLYYSLRFQLLGGGYMIKGNNFSEISACPTVSSGIIYIGMGLRLNNDKSMERGFVWEVYQNYLQFQMITPSLYLLREDQNLFKDPQRLVDYAPLGGSFYVKTQSVSICGNRYVNVSMGADQYLDYMPIAGALIKLANILSAKISDEHYENVGAYTDEFSMAISSEIYGRIISLATEKTLFYMYDYVENAFFNKYLSSSLIYATQINQLIISGSNSFKNIWLIDYQKAMMKDQGQALLLKVQNSLGNVYFSGAFIQDVRGFVNEFTINRLENWRPSQWYNQYKNYNEDITYGAGAPLILVNEDSNYINNFTIENVTMKNLYFRAVQETTILNRAPAILSIISPYQIQDTDEEEKRFINYLIIRNVSISDSTYEKASHFFELKGRNIVVDNFRAQNIGNQDFLDQPDWQRFKDIPLRFQPYIGSNSLVQLKLFRYISASGQYIATLTAFSNSIFSQINITHGGLPIFEIDLYKQVVSAPICTVKFQNLTIQDNSKSGNVIPSNVLASFIQIITQESPQLHIIIERGNFVNNSASNGIFYSASKLYRIEFLNCYFAKNKGNYASIFYFQNQPFQQMLIKDSNMSDEMDSSAYLNFLRSPDREKGASSVLAGNSLIKLTMTVGLNIIGCLAFGNSQSIKGAFIDIQQGSSVDIQDSLIRDMVALNAGAIYLFQRSKLSIQNTTFTRVAAVDTGVIQVSENSNLTVSNSSFINNAAVTNGVFKISGDSYFQFRDTNFEKNQAQKNSIGHIIQASQGGSFTRIKVKGNQAWLTDTEKDQSQGIALEILSCQGPLIIDQSDFADNQATTITPNIYLSDVKSITVTDSIFWNRYRQPENLHRIYGGFINIIARSKIFIRSSQFINGTALQGGAIFSWGDTNIEIQQAKFLENMAQVSGGAIQGDSIAQLHVNKNTLFYKNSVTQLGDSIMIQNSPLGQIIISSAKFTSGEVSNFVYVIGVLSLDIFDSSFSLDKKAALINEKTAGVLLVNIGNLKIERTSFSRLQGSNRLGGGALIVEETQTASKSAIGLIADCNFEESYSVISGGGLSIISVGNMTLIRSKFYNNKAENQGGALLYSCNQYPKQCSLLLEDILFKNNSANIEGGAIKWNFFEPLMKNITFIENNAKIYGDNIASVARNLVKISQQDVGQSSLVTSVFTNEDEQKAIQSGGKTSLYFGLIDKYGSFIRVDSKSKLLIKPPTLQTDHIVTLIESSTQILCEAGLYKVDDMTLVARPNTSQVITFFTDGIDMDIPDNGQSLLEIDEHKEGKFFELANNRLDIRFIIRPCLIGEAMLSSGKCVLCEEGTYLIQATSEPTFCKKCPIQEAECLGGSTIFPQAGYWRSSNYSDQFIKCLNPIACVGKNIDIKQQCLEGYQGVLCSDCAQGYSKSVASFKCSECPSMESNIIIIAAIIIIVGLFLIILIISNLNSALKEKNYLPVFLRVLLNHLQILTLSGTFDLNWPTPLLNFYRNIQPFGEASSQILSIDCFIKTQSTNYISDVPRVFLLRVIILAIFPIVAAAVSFIVWKIALMIKYRASKIKQISRELDNSDRSSGVEKIAITEFFSPESQKKRKSSVYQDEKYLRETSMKLNISGAQLIPSSNQAEMGLNEKQVTKELESIKEEEHAQDTGKIISTIIVLLFFLHPTITREMFNVFNCKTIEGVERVLQDLEIVCYQGQHSIYAYWIALPSLIVYSVGIPTLGLYILYQKRHEFETLGVKQRYGFLYNGYRAGFAQFWELIIIYRKVILIFIQVFLPQKGKIVQAMVALLFLIVCASPLLLFIKPYDRAYLNNLELVSLMTSSISIYFGVFFISDSFAINLDEEKPLGEDTKLFMFTVIVLSHAFFFCYWLQCFFNEFRLTIRQRYPRLYTTLFLCCREARLKHELEIDDAIDKMRPFLRKYEDLLEFLKKRKVAYDKGEIPAEDKELREKLFSIDQLKKKIENQDNYMQNSSRFTKIEVLAQQKSIKNDLYSNTPKSILSKSSKTPHGSSQPQTPQRISFISSKQISLRPSGIANSSLILRRNQTSKFKKDTVSLGKEFGRDHAINSAILSAKDWVKYDEEQKSKDSFEARSQNSSGLNTPTGAQLEKITSIERINRRNMQFDDILLDKAPPTRDDVSPAAYSHNWQELNSEIAQKGRIKQMKTPKARSDQQKASALSFTYLTEQRKMDDQEFKNNQLADIYMIKEEDADQLEGQDHSRALKDSDFSESGERALAFYTPQEDYTPSAANTKTVREEEDDQVSGTERYGDEESAPSLQQLDIQIRSGRQLLSDSRSRKQVKKGRVIQKSRNQRMGKSTTTLEPEQVKIDEEIIDV